MCTTSEYIANIQNTNHWQSAEVKAAQIHRLKEAHKNTVLTDKQFSEKYQFRVITEKLPPILRKVGLDKEADECANSPDLGTAISNSKKAYGAANLAAYWAAYYAALDAAYGAAYRAAKDQKDAILAQYVDLMVEILNGKAKAEVNLKDFPHTCARCGSPAYIGFSKTDCSKGCK